jgi:cardiolipin synthase
MYFWHAFYFEISALIGLGLMLITIPCVLVTKKNPTSAVAWCLLIFFVPVLGSLCFLFLGYQQLGYPLRRKQKQKKRFQMTNPATLRPSLVARDTNLSTDAVWGEIAGLARRFGAFPAKSGNRVVFYYEGTEAFAAKLEAIRAAKHHIHLEYFIFQPDETGHQLLDLLAQKAREGVEVRLLYDGMGSHRLGRRSLRPLIEAGGKCRVFLALNPIRRRIQINLRDHRKILVVDGRVAFTGGLNIGDEYLSKVKRYGFWRDTHLRVEGPAVAGLQRIFAEDWDFATGENLLADAYFPEPRALEADTALPSSNGASRPLSAPMQIIQSGPDNDYKPIREIYFAAMQRARKRLWIATPYFVPDPGILDALCLAGYTGVDVRLLCQYHPDKWLPFFAGRYYWEDVLNAGVKVYQYWKGMMHAKVVLVDGEWASVGTANLDYRSLHLNFEVNTLIYSPEAVAELEAAYLRDLETSILIDRQVFAQRPLGGKLLDNACRLLSPVL